MGEVKNEGPKTVKNGPRVWAFCKIEFPGIQKPVHIFDQKSPFFEKCGNRGVGVIWWVVGGLLVGCSFFFGGVGASLETGLSCGGFFWCTYALIWFCLAVKFLQV